MRKIWILSVLVTIGLSAASMMPSRTAGSERKFIKSENPIANRYIVVLNDDLASASYKAAEITAAEMTAMYGGSVERVYNAAFQGYSIEMGEKAAHALSEDPRVRFVAEDAEMGIDATQQGATWGLDRIDQRLLPLTGSYTYGSTGQGVNVYIIDTGIRATHAEFGGRAQSVYDSVLDGQNGNDCSGHGTHVAGTIGGSSFGVAKNVNLRSVRVLGCDGLGSLSTVLAGVDWVTANRVAPAVVNMSLGGNANDLLDWVIENSISTKGLTYVVAAGNSNEDACGISPARAPNVITVGASNNQDRKAAFSNWGSCLDIFAPGDSVVSASYLNDGAQASMSGTSMAAPHVTGAVAIFLQANPAANAASVSSGLRSRATAGAFTGLDAASPNLLMYSQPLIPTAGSASITGKVRTSMGRGISRAVVTALNPQTGESWTRYTNQFGYFTYSDLDVGQIYFVSVYHKRYNFPVQSMTVSLDADVAGANFVGDLVTY